MKPSPGPITVHRVLLVTALLSVVFIVSTTGADVVSHQETDVLELEPAGEGTYTQIDDDTGEIQIILTEENPNLNAEGVNPNAVTDIGPVFTVENVLEQRSNATVWISHDSDAVEFYVPGEGTVESQADGVFMKPGDSATIAMRVDTRETDEVTLDAVYVKAILDPGVSTATFESSDNDGSDDSDSSGAETETDSETPTETTPGTETDTETDSGGSEPGSPTPTTTPGVGTPTPTEDLTGEQAGLEPSSLLWLLAILGGLLLLFALARRRRNEE